MIKVLLSFISLLPIDERGQAILKLCREKCALKITKFEIIVSKLVGATNSFIRRPFLYTGFFYGLGGGLLASLIVLLLLNGLTDPLAELSKHYGQDFGVGGFDGRVIAILLVLSSLLGWLGAWLAVGRRLSCIEPE